MRNPHETASTGLVHFRALTISEEASLPLDSHQAWPYDFHGNFSRSRLGVEVLEEKLVTCWRRITRPWRIGGAARSAAHQGVECLQYETHQSSQEWVVPFWLEPTHGCVVCALERTMTSHHYLYEYTIYRKANYYIVCAKRTIEKWCHTEAECVCIGQCIEREPKVSRGSRDTTLLFLVCIELY